MSQPPSASGGPEPLDDRNAGGAYTPEELEAFARRQLDDARAGDTAANETGGARRADRDPLSDPLTDPY
ncbi:MAG: hypothetical protein L0H31_10755, partial [Nocardioidaceae bacterium]|nr:hypothetical protein [Nocardioidaceae bacterium]